VAVALAMFLGGLLAWGAGAIGGSPGVEAKQPAFADVHLHIAVPRVGGAWAELDVSMLLLIEPGADAEAEAVTARDGMLARFPGAVDLSGGDVMGQFVVTPYSWAAKSATWSYNPAGKPEGLTGDSEAIEAGARTWNGASGADWRYTRGPDSGAGPGLCEGGQPDKENVIAWVPSLPGSTLATTCTYFPGGNVKESDIALDMTREWTTGLENASVDLQSVALHEFGHMLGLAHSPDRNTVMYSTYSRGTDKRTLTTDDMAGLVSIYGSAISEPPATPTPTPVAAPGLPPRLVAPGLSTN